MDVQELYTVDITGNPWISIGYPTKRLLHNVLANEFPISTWYEQVIDKRWTVSSKTGIKMYILWKLTVHDSNGP